MDKTSEKVELFVVNVTIIEGRHLAWPNMDSAVHVRVDNQKKCTAVRYSTDCPFFNEFFVFELTTTVKTLMDKTVTLTVIQPRKCLRSKKTLGYVTLDMATVWSQPDHQFYHKWAVIAPTINDPAGGPVGYVKVDISILRKGETPKIPTIDPEDTDEIEGNLLLPEGMATERQRASYVCKIYRAENLSKGKYLDSTTAPPLEKDPPNSYIEVSFAGLKARTSTKKNINPEWNESLTLTELFPPLCQRIKIRLCYTDCYGNTNFAVRNINLRSISNDGEHGFLPTFGPTFLHFYAKGDCSEGYVGKMLMSFNTDLQLNTVGMAKSIRMEPITRQLNVNSMWKTELVLVYGIILNANLIDKKYANKLISYEVNFGNSELQTKTNGGGDNQAFNVTQPLEPFSKGKLYWCLKYGQDKPSVFTLRYWPDLRQRLYNSNMISKIAEELKSRLDQIEELFVKEQFKMSDQTMETLLLEAIDSLSCACRKYIDINRSKFRNSGTELDRERRKLCLREMGDIEDTAKEMYNPKMKNKCFKILLDIHSRLQILIEDPQDCWPDVYLTMVVGNKRVAFFKCPIANLIFSVVDEEQGNLCGKTQNLFLQSNSKKPQPKVACNLEIFLWVGLERYRKECFKSFPSGFKPSTDSSQKELPRYLVAQDKHGRVHIYQGKFLPGSDRSGLCDPFARVIIGSDCHETTVAKATLNPVWDQTLIYKQLIVYGAQSYIKSSPPLIVMEVFDQDECCKIEFVGRCILKPVIKFSNQPYAAPHFPPKLSWHKICKCEEVLGEVLAVAEFLETSEKSDVADKTPSTKIVKIPSDIKPTMVAYRLEVIFWGVRDLQKIFLLPVTKPKVSIECGYVVLHSDTILSTNKTLNFTHANKQIDVNLPDQEEYAPPICIKLFDCRSFGRYTLAGTYIVSLNHFRYYPLTKEQRIHKFLDVERNSLESLKSKHMSVPIITIGTEINNMNLKTSSTSSDISSTASNNKNEKITNESAEQGSYCKKFFNRLFRRNRNTYKKNCKAKAVQKKVEVESEDLDWWTKYYDSVVSTPKKQIANKPSNNEYCTLEQTQSSHRTARKSKHILKIYPYELEAQPEFEGFSDTLQSFQMYKGKRTGDETVDEANITGILKGAIKLYRWPPENDVDYVTETGLPLNNGAFQSFPTNDPLKFVVRIYCVKGINLRPKDANGKSDPYIVVNMGGKIINDKDNYVPKQVNPIFGRCFELTGVFPHDHAVTISVWDWDLTTSPDLIGETKIDLENRLYTKHRAHCGMSYDYQTIGYNSWRDQETPSRILENLCRKNNIDVPNYTENCVEILLQEFYPRRFSKERGQTSIDKDTLALHALHRWQEVPVVGCHLVPEHVETRSLYHAAKPGIEQGKLQLWIDIFPSSDLPPPPIVNIAPRKPVAYELRVIIWNTNDVILEEDDFFVGEKMSDIYVIGWLTGPEESQCTDVHYRSMTGEGNFNWRFIFRFKYYPTENKLVKTKKESLFSIDETEFKFPCRLTLQVWDNDTISADDFLGIVVLELARLPRGARSAETCTLNNLAPNAPTINLFKTKRTKGWWPFRGRDQETNVEILAGKVEVELEIVTAEEADKNPVGLARAEPQPLPKPLRPDTSFSWFFNPLKGLKFLICKHYRWTIIKSIILILLIFGIGVGVYSVPGYSVKKLLHV